MENPTYEKAVFAGGCFWCTEAVFKMLKGVESVVPGYTGGTVENPTYERISLGKTGHAEAVEITYDPSKVRFEDLLTVFFGSHDPTTKDRQGNDVGTQYRSVIFYTNGTQKAAAEKLIADINASSKDGAPVVTEVVPLTTFYPAEDYHRDYYERNKFSNPYCEIVINPKLEKVVRKYGEFLKEQP
jgi:peptide-methionine (S)-S-oxide reductase